MTKQEFIDRCSAETRHSKRRDLRFTILSLGLIGATAAAAKWMLKYIEESDIPTALLQDVGCWLVGAFGVLFILAAFASEKLPPFVGVSCQNCDRHLDGIDVRIAFLTGNCGYCGERIVDDFGGKLDSERGPGIYMLQKR